LHGVVLARLAGRGHGPMRDHPRLATAPLVPETSLDTDQEPFGRP
jgi:hypothetical protein